MFPHGDFCFQRLPFEYIIHSQKPISFYSYSLYLIMDLTKINLIHYAIPGFILLILVELIFSAIQKRELYETRDTISSLAMGIGNVITGLVSKSLILLCFFAAYEFRLFTLGWTWPIWVLGFFAEDFCYYWFHRLSHS